MSELFQFFGWTIPQWRKAIEYHDLLNPTAPFDKKPAHLVQAIIDGNVSQWQDLQEFWRARRKDEPLEVVILAADGKERAK